MSEISRQRGYLYLVAALHKIETEHVDMVFYPTDRRMKEVGDHATRWSKDQRGATSALLFQEGNLRNRKPLHLDMTCDRDLKTNSKRGDAFYCQVGGMGGR